MAQALRSKGHQAIVPNLVAAAETGDPGLFARAAVEAADSVEPTVVVGHSGAGAALPLIAAGLSVKPYQLTFVDAGVPPCEGTFSAGGDFLGALRENPGAYLTRQ